MGRKKPPAKSEHEIRGELAEKLAARAGVDVTNYRYVETSYHNGINWTVATQWQRLVGDEWLPVPSEDFPTFVHASGETSLGQPGR